MKGFRILILLFWHGTALALVPDGAAIALHTADFGTIDTVARTQVRDGHIPGAVILIGNDRHTLYRKAFGYRAHQPRPLRMRTDDIFDLASLTKVIATTTAVMQLVERGDIQLDAPIARYWPAFGANGKAAITVRQALTHYSGLRPDLPGGGWSGYRTALDMIVAEAPARPPGSSYAYSDINFEVLGELVERVSGQALDTYCRQHIFRPLGMRNTGFRPSPALRERLVPSVMRNKKIAWGEVNDPWAARMGGVAGHAGLFSTVDDLAIFARMLLNGGSYRGATILQPDSVALMTSPQALPTASRQRGLGWNLDAPVTDSGNIIVPTGFYGHTGYTGTSLWIDPVTHTFAIVLTNRVFPDDRGDVGPLRNGVAAALAGAIQHAADTTVARTDHSADKHTAATTRPVRSGLDVLAAEQFAPLQGKRVGLITNQSGLDAFGRSAIELLQHTPGVRLRALFSPEHGLYGNVDAKVASGIDPVTKLPVYSLYGRTLRPTPAMLQGLDALVFDIQGAGARFYTYTTTLAYAMEAAARAGIDFYVLDRPNPIGANRVQGPLLDNDMRSFTGYFPLPICYGMTPGELALMYNRENHIGAKLHVIRMRGYQRSRWYDQTGLRWVNPSPNLRSLTQTALYPGVALVEGANVSVGRGTDTPFELLGAPWIDGHRLAHYLSRRDIPGVAFSAVRFTPSASRYRDQRCNGVRIRLEDRNRLNAPKLGVEITSALYRLYPNRFHLDATLGMIGARAVLSAIRDGEDPRSIAADWQVPLDRFLTLREQYLLY